MVEGEFLGAVITLSNLLFHIVQMVQSKTSLWSETWSRSITLPHFRHRDLGATVLEYLDRDMSTGDRHLFHLRELRQQVLNLTNVQFVLRKSRVESPVDYILSLLNNKSLVSVSSKTPGGGPLLQREIRKHAWYHEVGAALGCEGHLKVVPLELDVSRACRWNFLYSAMSSSA